MADGQPPKARTRTFFKKPDWLKNTEPKEESKGKEHVDLFSRSRDSYQDILDQEEQRKKDKEERKQKAAEVRESKRRRISEDEPPTNPDDKRKPISPVVSPVRRKNEKKPAPTPTVIDLEDSDDDNYQEHNPLSASNESDPTGSALPARITRSSPRGKVRTEKLVERDSQANHPTIDIPDDDDEDLYSLPAAPFPTRSAATSTLSRNTAIDRSAPNTDEPDPVINILIHPRIDGTEPLVVKRKYRQRLRECREAWCERQENLQALGVTPSDIIFAYRGHRVFDFSTIKTLGIQLDEGGNPVFAADEHGHEEPGDQIVIVATTHKLLEEDRRAEEEAQRQRELGQPEEQPVVEAKPLEPLIKIVLKAKDHDDFNLTVRPVRAIPWANLKPVILLTHLHRARILIALPSRSKGSTSCLLKHR